MILLLRLLNCVAQKFRGGRRLGLPQLVFLSIPQFVLFFAPAGLSADDGTNLFETNIRPLMVEHCQKCHGAIKQEAGLRLDSRAALMSGGEHGPAIVPGKPDKSLLISAVRHQGDVRMPPKGKLKDKQIQDLEQWILLGAPWPASLTETHDKLAETQRRHWAFQPVLKPALPEVKDSKWERTPVDRFILAKLDESGLSPSSVADRRTLIRRVTFDLTGLPPSFEQVEAFVNDPSVNAYEKLVERLLDLPQYGEQWARHWLDVARYADTKGYVYGREERFWVHAPAYRDWVVNAFNGDLPYNQFLLLQIAADQAAAQDRGAQAAMGFLTLGRRFLGVTHDIIDDRIDVVTRGPLGLTVACARCHDHKYDPIPTADYYSLYGVFLNSTERMLAVADPSSRDDAYAAFEKELSQRQQKLKETTLTKRNEAADRVRQRITDYLVAQTEISKYPEEGFDQVLATTDLIPTFVRRWEAWLESRAGIEDSIFGPWRRFTQLKSEEFPEKSAGIVRDFSDGLSTVNPRVRSALEQPPTSMRDVAERYGKLLQDVNREWKEACDAANQSGGPPPEKLPSEDTEALRQILYGPASPCLVPDEGIVSTELYFDSGSVTELWKLRGEVDRWLIQSPLAPAHAVSLVDRNLIRPSRVFRRGNPVNRGPEVTRHFVSVLAGPEPASFTTGSGRLELANAIIDPANPLTARVWVNRVWQHHFGTGLVRTPSDFGIRAEPPSHPELLDWLATRFVTDGWSTKQLHRLILLSSTYQQSSDGTVRTGRDLKLAGEIPRETVSTSPVLRSKLAAQVDPENRLLSRMNVRRLSFEEFRDSLLAISGRLDTQMGGRATDLFAGNGTVNRRRTIYGLVDRQFLATTLRIFDFPNPDLHIPVRSETTVPQQALFALNHPFVAQQAQELVERINRDATNEPSEQKLRRLYQTVFQREPTARQLDIAQKFLDAEIAEPTPSPASESLAWQYGYGELDETTKQLKTFTALPHFSGAAWQGGTQFPDATLGWVQLTAQGGHPGNDIKHSSIRRWVAPHDGRFSISSTAVHEVAAGNGIRCWIFSSTEGMLMSHVLHNQRQAMNVANVALKKGDSIDFVVDINGDLNSDQYLWAPEIVDVSNGDKSVASQALSWKSERDFSGPMPKLLSGWEQFAQVLLIANELMFVD